MFRTLLNFWATGFFISLGIVVVLGVLMFALRLSIGFADSRFWFQVKQTLSRFGITTH